MKKSMISPSISLLIVAFLFIATAAIAADQSKVETLTFEWEQPEVDLPSLQGWNFYVSDSATGPWTKVANVPYVVGSGPDFTSEATLTVTGAPGSTIQKFFAATAVNKDGIESTYATGQPNAQEVTKEFYISYPGVSGPFNLKIKVIIHR